MKRNVHYMRKTNICGEGGTEFELFGGF